MNADTKPRIGFIGLGLMGHGMAKNLVTKGYPLTVCAHRTRKPLEDLLAAGAREVTTHAEVARQSDIVFLCVTGTPQIDSLAYGDTGLFQQCVNGATGCTLEGVDGAITTCAGVAELAGTGRLVAMDIHQPKLDELRRRARRAGVTHIDVDGFTAAVVPTCDGDCACTPDDSAVVPASSTPRLVTRCLRLPAIGPLRS